MTIQGSASGIRASKGDEPEGFSVNSSSGLRLNGSQSNLFTLY